MSRQQTSAPFGVPRGEGGANHVPTLVDENSAASELFDQFCTANTFQGIMGYFQQMCDLLGVRPEDHRIFYRQLKPRLVSWKAQSLWARLDRCATRREYKKGTACTNTRVLIIGGGPCGLRVAIEVAFLGGKAVIVEKRDRYSRNNVLHLWPYLIHDLKALGAKKFFGKFCASSIDHISIRTLQCILLKAALLVGVEVHPGVTFENILEPVADRGDSEKTGWRVKVSPSNHPVSEFEFDVLLGADGKRNTLAGFRRKEFRGKLAIAVTANFINHNSQQEARVEEISGVAFIFNQKFFRELNRKTNVDLENIVYYKDETHYFVMTAKKHSLLIKGVIQQDYDDPERLLARKNVDQDALMAYAKEAAEVSTNHLLPDLEFAHNHYGQADVAMFDFTSMYHAEHASRVIERAGHKLLVALVGDSLLEPFWPMGTGCARGFLGAQDTAWMIRSWASGRQTPLEVMAERESIYQLLSQTTPENTCKSFSQYTIDPKTRYTNLNPHCVLPHQVKHQYDGGDLVYLNEIVQISEQNCKRYEWMRDQHYLLKWFQRQLEPYRSLVKVLDMTSSWRNGMALCALIHHYRPDLMDVYALCPNKVSENNQMAFDLAEKEFGIRAMMSGEDMSMCDSPDLATMVSYLSQFYELFRKEVKVFKEKKTSESLQARLARMSKINSRIRQRKDGDREDKENQEGEGAWKRPIFTYGMAKRRIKEMSGENNGEGSSDPLVLDMEERRKRLGVHKDPTLRGLEAGMLGKNTVSMLAEDLAKKFRGEEPTSEVKKLNPQPLTLGQPAPVDVCYFCDKKVYLVEKCTAEGVYFHRGCLRCHYCGTNLRLGAYTFQRSNGDRAMFFCIQHYGMTKPACRAKKRTFADNGAEVPTTPSPVATNPDEIEVDGLESTPERIEFDIESEQEESEFEQTAHNLSGSLLGVDSDSDSDESSDDELHWSDPEVSDGQMSWADLADTYRRQLRRSMRRRHSQQQQQGGATDSDDTATIGSSGESWQSESETEKESEADDLKEPPRRKKMRRQEVKPESKFSLDPLSHSFGVDTKPSPTSVEMMRNRMSFFSTVSEPVRIDAHEFLGLIPPTKASSSWSGSTQGETAEVQTGKVQGAVLSRLSDAIPPIAIVTSDDESETEKVSQTLGDDTSPLSAQAPELVDSDTTPTEPSQEVSCVTLAEQEDSEVGEDFCTLEGSGEETGEDEREMKEYMERLLSEEMVDGEEDRLNEGGLESSDISDYDERHDLDKLVANNEDLLSDELLETDLLLKNAKDVSQTTDMLQEPLHTEMLVGENALVKDVEDASEKLYHTDVLVVNNAPGGDPMQALQLTDALVSNNVESTSHELCMTDMPAGNNAPGVIDDVESRPKGAEFSLELDQTNTLVAINLETTNVSQQLDQTDVLVANNLESADVSQQQEKKLDTPVEDNLDSTELSPLERTDALVANNSEDVLEATNLSELVACNVDHLSDDDSLLHAQTKQEPEPITEVPASDDHSTHVSVESEDVLVTGSIEVTRNISAETEVVDPHTEECPVGAETGEMDSEGVGLTSSLEDTHTLSLLAAENADPLSETGNLSDIMTLNAQQLMPDDSLLYESQMGKKAEADITRPESGTGSVQSQEERKEQLKAEGIVEVPSAKAEEVVGSAKVEGDIRDTKEIGEEVTGSALLRTEVRNTEVTKAEEEVLNSAKAAKEGLEYTTSTGAAFVDSAQDTSEIKDLNCCEAEASEVSDTGREADVTEGKQTDMTVELSTLVTDNQVDDLGCSVDLSQLVASNKDHLPVDDSVFQPAVTSSGTVVPPAVSQNDSERSDEPVTTAVTGDSVDTSEKSSTEADAIKRIDSLLHNLSKGELADFQWESVSSQSAKPSLIEVSITDNEHGSRSVIVNETFINTTDRGRRKKHMSSSSSTTDTRSASSVPSEHGKPQPDLEDSLSLDRMVAVNADPCDGSMEDMLKDNATPDSSLAKLDPISRVEALIGSDSLVKSGARNPGVVNATPRLTPDLRKASSTSGVTASDDSFHTPSASHVEPVVTTPSKLLNPKVHNLSSHISSSEPKLTQEKQRLVSCKSWSDSQSDTSDQRSLASLRTTDSANSSPLYSPNQVLVDAKRKFFFDTPQPVRFDHRSVLKDVPKCEQEMDRGITSTSTPVEGNTAHALNGSPDVFFTPATSMKPKNRVAGKPWGADIRRQVLMKTGTPESSDGGASEKSTSDTAQLTKSASLQTPPIDIVGTSRQRPSSARSLPEKSFSVDSPYKTPLSSMPPALGKAGHKGLKKQKSKDDEKENKKGKRRSFLSMFLPSKNAEKKEKGPGKDRVLSPEVPEKMGKSKGQEMPEKSGKEKGPEMAHVRQAEAVKQVVVRPQGRKEVRRPLSLTKDEAENRRSIYDEFGPLMGDMFGEQWKEATQERLKMVAPPPAKAPHTALLAPKAALEEFDTESETGDDMMSLRSFQSQGLSEDEATRLQKKHAKAALRKRREQEQQRLHVAQQIQRQLEEVELKQREVEKRGVVIERVLRGDGPDSLRDETELMQMWFNIVHEKNLLVRYESELMVHARELELEDRHSRLEQQYRERMQMNDAEKTVEMREEDERLLQELLEVVEQRDALVAMLDDDRVKQRTQDEELKEMMLLKGYELSPDIPEYKWQPPQSIFSSASDTR